MLVGGRGSCKVRDFTECQGYLSNFWLNAHQHICGGKPPARESIIKIQQGRQFPKLTYGLEEITFSSARGKRCLNTWGIRHNIQKGLFYFFCKSLHRIGIILSLSVWKKNSSGTIHDLCLEFPFRESFCCLLGFQLL